MSTTTTTTTTPASTPSPKVSIIVPMYRCEAYVDGLMDMLLNQTLRDLELICVVDGSPDDTLAKVERHAERDSRVRVISQEHAGAGAARNAGARMARGEYLMFLDADDLYPYAYVGRMVRTADEHQADMVVCRFRILDCHTGIVRRGAGYDVTRVRAGTPIDTASLRNPFAVVHSYAHNKLWRHAFVREQGLRFSETMSVNDCLFVWASIASARRTVFLNEELYTYRHFHNRASISSNRSQFGADLPRVFGELRQWLLEQGRAEGLRESYCHLWRRMLRGAAGLGASEQLQESCAQMLAEEELWSGLDGMRLRGAAGLDTSIAKLRLRLARRGGGKPGATQSGRARWQVARLESEIANKDAICEILNMRHGKTIPIRESLPQAIAWELRSRGIRSSIALAWSRLSSRLWL